MHDLTAQGTDPKLKVAVSTLGCKLNQYDSESMLAQFRAAGHEVVDSHADASLHIVNTCAVTATAERKVRTLIRSIARSNPDAKLYAVGCMAERSPETLSAIPGVSGVIGNSEKSRILDFVGAATADGSPRIAVGEQRLSTVFEESLPVRGLLGRTRAFLKVQDGCSQKCTYCVIPSLRGRGRSLTIEKVVERARILAAEGFREIVLTGVALGTYGFDWGTRDGLSRLIEALSHEPSIQRLRLGSVEPWAVTTQLLKVIACSEKICPHLHIPLQSGEDRTLHRMNRRYTVAEIDRIFSQAYALRDDWGFGSDIIVGFPGETDDDFEQTVRYLESAPISYLHIFPFSVRPGTPASKLPDRVDETAKSARVTRLKQLDAEKRLAFSARNLGAVRSVLIENRTSGNLWAGHAENYLDVFLNGPLSVVGTVQNVRIIRRVAGGVVGDLLPQ